MNRPRWNNQTTRLQYNFNLWLPGCFEQGLNVRCFMAVRSLGYVSRLLQGVVGDVSGGGVIIPHYPHTRRLCSPVTPGFIELAAAIEPTHSSCSTLSKKILYRWKIYTIRHTSQISHSSDGQPVVGPTKFNISDAASNLVTMCYLRIDQNSVSLLQNSW